MFIKYFLLTNLFDIFVLLGFLSSNKQDIPPSAQQNYCPKTVTDVRLMHEPLIQHNYQQQQQKKEI